MAKNTKFIIRFRSNLEGNNLESTWNYSYRRFYITKRDISYWFNHFSKGNNPELSLNLVGDTSNTSYKIMYLLKIIRDPVNLGTELYKYTMGKYPEHFL